MGTQSGWRANVRFGSEADIAALAFHSLPLR